MDFYFTIKSKQGNIIGSELIKYSLKDTDNLETTVNFVIKTIESHTQSKGLYLQVFIKQYDKYYYVNYKDNKLI